MEGAERKPEAGEAGGRAAGREAEDGTACGCLQAGLHGGQAGRVEQHRGDKARRQTGRSCTTRPRYRQTHGWSTETLVSEGWVAREGGRRVLEYEATTAVPVGGGAGSLKLCVGTRERRAQKGIETQTATSGPMT